ncbi:hypothetical protein [Actinoplanes friuliensis]|uniref:Uncharacterized protein n=1 Tax=Actinoplanes friuliensis DSM 7358 TaxID=1246995 RepID=U5W7L1_9ACTN|nr:hypothetical protein [Actinoplanes friuliensis]AGZ45178.1 hypothetical protein AFR_34610 [Actinoplanes friuliensis DSM 7358]
MRGRWPVQLARGAGVVVLAVLVGVGVRQGWFPEWNWIERVSWLAGIVGVVVALLALRKPQQRPARTPRQDRRFLPDPRQELKVFAGTGWSSTLRELYPGTKLVTFGGREFPIWAELGAAGCTSVSPPSRRPRRLRVPVLSSTAGCGPQPSPSPSR